MTANVSILNFAAYPWHLNLHMTSYNLAFYFNLGHIYSVKFPETCHVSGPKFSCNTMQFIFTNKESITMKQCCQNLSCRGRLAKNLDETSTLKFSWVLFFWLAKCLFKTIAVFTASWTSTTGFVAGDLGQNMCQLGMHCNAKFIVNNY